MEDTPLPPTEGVAAILARTKQKPWFMDPPLRNLYALLIPACLFVCATNGYDGSMINGIQAGMFVYCRLMKTVVLMLESEFMAGFI